MKRQPEENLGMTPPHRVFPGAFLSESIKLIAPAFRGFAKQTIKTFIDMFKDPSWVASVYHYQ
jgi:hypothetical protein